MPENEPTGLRCFLALRYGPKFHRITDAVKKGVSEAGFQPISIIDEAPRPMPIQQVIVGELARADCVIADLTEHNPNVFYELGLAQAMGKPSFLLMREDWSKTIPFDVRAFQLILYRPTSSGISQLAKDLTRALNEYRRTPSLARAFTGVPTPFSVDWDRLDETDAENLCRELLLQMGYQRVDWLKTKAFDLIAELPKKDPDGFEYRELWLVALGRNAPAEIVLEMAEMESDFLRDQMRNFDRRLSETASQATTQGAITVLIILLKGDRQSERLDRLRHRIERRMARGPYASSLRVRIWDRSYLTSLVQRFPHIGYKYFSDEGRSRSKFRKTPEDLYRENVELANRQTELIAELQDEKNKRIRAERDAIWKDISFAAAHKIGNPLFAIETNLDPLEKRISEGRIRDAIEVTRSIRASVEKAKGIVDQFKSLTRAQEISPVTTLLNPILEDACKTARAQGVTCEIDCPDGMTVEADPERLAESFDELAFNSTLWFDKPNRRIEITVTPASATGVPQFVDSTRDYVLIHFRDNGTGVLVENKSRIFDAFFTTREHGTGLGLALVRRIIEGHGGTIFESGIPGKGADFEVYLPVPPKASEGDQRDIQPDPGPEEQNAV